MICKKCGARIADDAQTCEFCGAVFNENDVTVAGEVNNEEVVSEPLKDEETEKLIDENDAKRQAQMERMRLEKQMRLEEIEKRRIDKKRKDRRNRVIIALFAVLCICAIALGVYYISTSSDNTDDVVIVTARPTVEPTSTPETTPTPEPTVAPTSTPEVIETVAPVVATKAPATAAKPKATVKPKAATKPKATAKPATKTAAPATSYLDISKKNNGTYVFANSSTTLLTAADVQNKSAAELRIARNEIYARHGRAFSNKAVQEYFNSCSWYKVNSAYDYANEYMNLSDTERANIKLIKEYEAK